MHHQRKNYEDGSKLVEDKIVYYKGVVIELGVPDDDVVCRVRRNNNSNQYLSEAVFMYYGTTTRSFTHLADIEHFRYVHLNDLISGRTGNAFPGLHQGNDGKNFFGGFVNHALVTDPSFSAFGRPECKYTSQIWGQPSAFAKISGCCL